MAQPPGLSRRRSSPRGPPSAHNLPALSILDWVILGFTGLLALYGYAQGFVVGALSLIGFAVGAFLGTRIAPLLLHSGDRSTYAPLFTLVGALLVGGVCASGLEAFGGRLRDRMRLPGFRALGISPRSLEGELETILGRNGASSP